MNTNQSTAAQINAEAARFQTEVGQAYTVAPNSYGVRIECNACRESATHDRAYRFPNLHRCPKVARVADFEERTVNADGTVNRVLYFV
jgi:hypothetical protein